MKRIILPILTICVALSALALLTASAGAETFWDHFAWDSAKQADEFCVVPTVPLPVRGDLDGSGDLEPGDARLALRFAIGLEPLLEEQHALWLADRDGDGAATPADARLILRDTVGLTNFRLPDADDDVYRIRTSGLACEYGELGALKALEVNAGAVTDSRGEHLPLWRIDSMETLEQWISAFRQAEHEEELKISDWELQPEPVDAEVLAFLKRYNKDYFAENDLFICYKTEGSGGYLQAAYPPAVQDGVLTLTVSTAFYEDRAAGCEIAGWLIFIPVSKELTKIKNGCHTFDCLLGDYVTLHENHDILTKDSFDNWLWAYSHILMEDARETLTPGTAFTFALLNKQDGGYLWEYESDAVVHPYEDREVADTAEGLWIKEWLVCRPHAAPGASSLHLYIVTADVPGDYTLHFHLKRPWETDSIDERTVTVTVQ